jgi:hypothetical protein
VFGGICLYVYEFSHELSRIAFNKTEHGLKKPSVSIDRENLRKEIRLIRFLVKINNVHIKPKILCMSLFLSLVAMK